MSGSSTEKSTADSDSTEPDVGSQKKQSEAKVPVQAVAQERAAKQAARAEADAAKRELEQLREQNPNIDPQQLAEIIAETVKSAVARELQPLRDETTLTKTAMKHGLNEVQMEEFARYKAETPGLTDDRALALMRLEKPDLFPQQRAQGFNSALHGGYPSGGDSPLRTSGDRPNHLEQMRQAQADGKVGEGSLAQQHAVNGFRELIKRAMGYPLTPTQ